MNFLKKLLNPEPAPNPEVKLRPIEIREQLYEIINIHLEPLGFFRKKPQDTWFRERCPDFLDLVHIHTNLPFNEGPVYCNAGLGIHYPQLERVLSKLMEQKYYVIAPTFVTYIGYVMPDKQFVDRWQLPRDRFDENIAHDLGKTIVKYAPSFFEHYNSLVDLRDGIIEYGSGGGWKILKLLTFEHLSGNHDLSLVMANKLIAEIDADTSGKPDNQLRERVLKAIEWMQSKK